MAQKNSFVKMPKRNIRVLSRIHKKYPRRLGDRGGFAFFRVINTDIPAVSSRNGV
jgi:hypothetical protein